MGAAWCKDRAAQAKDSKSPLDRVIVKCVNQMSLAERPISHNNFVQGPAKYPRLHLNPVSPQGRECSTDLILPNTSSEWQDVVLKVPDIPEERILGQAPVPPPRKKRTSIQNQQNQEKQKREKEHNQEELKVNEVQSKKSVPGTPVITLEVDTPTSKHRVRSSPVLDKEPQVPETKPRPESRESFTLKLPQRSKSSMSLRSASPVPEATAERLDNYMKSCRSFGSLKPEELLDEINQALSDSSNDSWAGLDDWDLGIVEHYDGPKGMSPPLTPTSQLYRSPTRGHTRAEFVVGELPQPKRKKKKKKRDKTIEDVKRRLVKPESNKNNSFNTDRNQTNVGGLDSHDDMLDVLSPPANFQTDPKKHIQSIKGGSSLIKPSQISVQDFLRQSNDKNKNSKLQENGKLMLDLPELKIDVPTENSTFSFDFSKGLMPPRSPQIEIPGTPNTPQGRSRCSSPLPSIFMNNVQTIPSIFKDNMKTSTPPSSPTNEETLSSWTEAEKDTNANLMRILQEYHCTADMIGDSDAKKILKELGIPEKLIDDVPLIHKPIERTEDKLVVQGDVERIVDECLKKVTVPDDNCSSGMSSMTPSLTELEASLSELLEASAANDGDEDDVEEELQNQTPQTMFTPVKHADTLLKAVDDYSRTRQKEEKKNYHPKDVTTTPPQKETSRVSTQDETKTTPTSTKLEESLLKTVNDSNTNHNTESNTNPKVETKTVEPQKETLIKVVSTQEEAKPMPTSIQSEDTPLKTVDSNTNHNTESKTNPKVETKTVEPQKETLLKVVSTQEEAKTRPTSIQSEDTLLKTVTLNESSTSEKTTVPSQSETLLKMVTSHAVTTTMSTTQEETTRTEISLHKSKRDQDHALLQPTEEGTTSHLMTLLNAV